MRLDAGQIEVVDDRVAEILRSKTGYQRLQMAWDAWSFYNENLKARLRSSHPEWTQEQIEHEILSRVSYGTK